MAARRVEALNDQSVRLALGASSFRLLRGSLVESSLAGVLGGTVGAFLAYGMVTPITGLIPADIPRVGEVAFGLGAAMSLVLAGGVVGVLVGAVAYGMSAKGRDAAPQNRARVAPGLSGRRVLVIGQVALTTLLVTGGAGVLQRMLGLQAVDVGFQPEPVQSTHMVLGQVAYPTNEEQLVFWNGLLDGLEERGVEAAVAVNPPMAGSTMPFGFRVGDMDSEQDFAQFHAVSPPTST